MIYFVIFKLSVDVKNEIMTTKSENRIVLGLGSARKGDFIEIE